MHLLTITNFLIIIGRICEHYIDMRRTKICMETDRISSLPCDVIDNILKYLPLCEAVRTSVLSREWRYQWETIPCLVFGSTCKVNLLRKYDWVSIIDQILLLHKGSITKFSLTIADLKMCRGIDNWLRFLSNCHVEELTFCFDFPDSHPVISEFLFTLDELTHLCLVYGELKPPPAFRGFERLVRLDLFNVFISAGEFKSFISKCPMLEYMKLESFGTKAIGDLEIDAPNLKFFSYRGRLSSICFKNTLLLAEMTMTSHRLKSLHDLQMPNDFAKFEPNDSNVVRILGQLPSITKLTVNRDFLQYLAGGGSGDGVPKKLPNDLNHMRLLTFWIINLSTIAEVTCALCLIRSSPKLQSLTITALGLRNPENLKTAAEFIKAQQECEITLSSLENINIRNFSGLEPEMEFVKLLLSAATALRKLEIITKNSNVSGKARPEIFEELVSSRRASVQAEIIVRDFDHI
ncbi:F-box/FBD/LRR-repeat protein At1g13570-like [Sesamum indicum]|uniref:F-box/FBD/LRR-repeat protein At1g13570-like n=1 Tax=Sesamum indicum TaxID=4182 RepID=A0A8M8UQ53_SESIN|nr:F-box/FBD/LRR-repeat protein At1g13570-like [Sesamum indicum]